MAQVLLLLGALSKDLMQSSEWISEKLAAMDSQLSVARDGAVFTAFRHLSMSCSSLPLFYEVWKRFIPLIKACHQFIDQDDLVCVTVYLKTVCRECQNRLSLAIQSNSTTISADSTIVSDIQFTIFAIQRLCVILAYFWHRLTLDISRDSLQVLLEFYGYLQYGKTDNHSAAWNTLIQRTSENIHKALSPRSVTSLDGGGVSSSIVSVVSDSVFAFLLDVLTDVLSVNNGKCENAMCLCIGANHIVVETIEHYVIGTDGGSLSSADTLAICVSIALLSASYLSTFHCSSVSDKQIITTVAITCDAVCILLQKHSSDSDGGGDQIDTLMEQLLIASTLQCEAVDGHCHVIRSAYSDLARLLLCSVWSRLDTESQMSCAQNLWTRFSYLSAVTADSASTVAKIGQSMHSLLLVLCTDAVTYLLSRLLEACTTSEKEQYCSICVIEGMISNLPVMSLCARNDYRINEILSQLLEYSIAACSTPTATDVSPPTAHPKRRMTCRSLALAFFVALEDKTRTASTDAIKSTTAAGVSNAYERLLHSYTSNVAVATTIVKWVHTLSEYVGAYLNNKNNQQQRQQQQVGDRISSKAVSVLTTIRRLVGTLHSRRIPRTVASILLGTASMCAEYAATVSKSLTTNTAHVLDVNKANTVLLTALCCVETVHSVIKIIGQSTILSEQLKALSVLFAQLESTLTPLSPSSVCLQLRSLTVDSLLTLEENMSLDCRQHFFQSSDMLSLGLKSLLKERCSIVHNSNSDSDSSSVAAMRGMVRDADIREGLYALKPPAATPMTGNDGDDVRGAQGASGLSGRDQSRSKRDFQSMDGDNSSYQKTTGALVPVFTYAARDNAGDDSNENYLFGHDTTQQMALIINESFLHTLMRTEKLVSGVSTSSSSDNLSNLLGDNHLTTTSSSSSSSSLMPTTVSVDLVSVKLKREHLNIRMDLGDIEHVGI